MFDGTVPCGSPDTEGNARTDERRLKLAQFGAEGSYQHRIPEGINSIEKTWKLTWRMRDRDSINDMVSYLRLKQGAAFPYLDKPTNETHQVYCDKWEVEWELRRHGDTYYGTMNAEFRKAFGAMPGSWIEPLPKALISFTNIDGLNLNSAKFSVTTREDFYLGYVVVYKVPAGQVLDKNVHPAQWFTAEDASTFTITWGTPGNLFQNADFAQPGPPPVLGRGWSIADGKLIHTVDLDNKVLLSGASDAMMWYTQHSPPTDNSWYSICWSPELEIFVAVAVGGSGLTKAMSSPDGINWTIRNTPGSTSAWREVCWSKELGLFIAVSTASTRVMKSSDGITWSTTTPGVPPSLQWRSVCWAKELGLFVAVADSGTGQRVMTSPNGIDWTLQNTPADNGWYCICWSPEKHLLVAMATTGTGNRCMTSPDGITWTLRAPPDSVYNEVCWSPTAGGTGRFVAVASTGTQRIVWSVDGITWTGVSPTIGFTGRSVCWSPEMARFVAVGTTTTEARVAFSVDGAGPWTQLGALGARNEYLGVAWSPKLMKWCAVSTANAINDEQAFWEWTSSFVAGDVWRGAVNIESISGNFLDFAFVREYNTDHTGLTSLFWGENWATPGIKRASEAMTFTGDRLAITAKTDTACVLDEWGAFRQTATHMAPGVYDFYAFPANHQLHQGDGLPKVTVTIG